MSPKLYASFIVLGESEDDTQSFSFAVNSWISDVEGNWYIGAHEPGAEKFALSFLARNNIKFDGCAHEKIELNGSKDQESPLYNKGIKHLNIFERKNLCIVTQDRPQDVCVLQNNLNIGFLCAGIHDAHGLETAEILNLAASDLHIFAAVRNNAGERFGEPGSGIALLTTALLEEKKDSQPDTENEEKKESTRAVLAQLSAPRDLDRPAGVYAAPLDITSDVVKINHDCSMFEDSITMHWDNFFKRLYVGLQVETGDQDDAGACALLVGKLENNFLVFEPAVPHSFFTADDDKIIGTVGSRARVAIHHLKTMVTTTRLHYLIVVGGNGDMQHTKRSVYVLPLISDRRSQHYGFIGAHTCSIKNDFYCNNNVNRFRFRAFGIEDSQLQPDNGITAYDSAALVGGGELPFGDITDVQTHGDTVFVSVAHADEGQYPGIFYSQALLDEQGKIKGWTLWRRAAGSLTNNIFKFQLGSFGTFSFLTGDHEEVKKTIKRTLWGAGNLNDLQCLGEWLQQEFPQEHSGIYGLFDFPCRITPGLDMVSLFIVTGLKKINIIESGSLHVHGLKATDYAEITNHYCDDGSIKQCESIGPASISLTGGMLNMLGAIHSAEIVHCNNMSWLCVGGNNGVAVLAHDDGRGYTNLVTGLQEFNDMRFYKLGTYKRVCKLIHDGSFLYILTDKTLERIDFSDINVARGNISAVTLACAARDSILGVKFNDCLISEKFALLATNNGLWRVGNNGDIRTALKQEEVVWTLVSIPESQDPVIQLFSASYTGRAQDCARSIGGHLYVLSGSRGKDRAQVNRFSVRGTEGRSIDDSIIQPIQDLFVEGIPSYFFSCGGFRSWIVTDGSLFLHAKDRDLKQSPILRGTDSKVIPLQFDGTEKIMRRSVRNSTSGSWILAGDFGVRINE